MTHKELCNINEICYSKYTAETYDHAVRVQDIVMHDSRYYLSNENDKMLLMVLALSHDLIEDTDCSLEELCSFIENEKERAAFQKALMLLTRDRENQTYMDYIKAIVDAGNLFAIIVKEADLADHLLRKETLKETLKVRYQLAAETMPKGKL